MSTVDKHEPGTIGWLDLMTTSVEAARPFYEQLFGWTIEIGAPEYGGYGMCTSGGRNAAGIGPGMPGSKHPPAWTVYFFTDDALATAARVTEHGGAVIMPPMDVMEQGRMMIASDATGAVFGVWQPNQHGGAQVANQHGAIAWAEVNTRDAGKASGFYAAVFDLEARKLEAPGMEYWTLHRDGRPVGGVLQMDDHWPAAVPAHWMPYFQVDDVDAATKQVTALGGKVCVAGFDSAYGRIAVVEDPQGATFSIMHPAASNPGPSQA